MSNVLLSSLIFFFFFEIFFFYLVNKILKNSREINKLQYWRGGPKGVEPRLQELSVHSGAQKSVRKTQTGPGSATYAEPSQPGTNCHLSIPKDWTHNNYSQQFLKVTAN